MKGDNTTVLPAGVYRDRYVIHILYAPTQFLFKAFQASESRAKLNITPVCSSSILIARRGVVVHPHIYFDEKTVERHVLDRNLAGILDCRGRPVALCVKPPLCFA